ncbi:GNAT family N-acetyltransferase [Parasphingopyxis sp.]|uniref:GNAT family N-acetyltransferase n=1 Tax=Parasphingopyxis sp. TaxID=1920299 RepID=UPI00261D7B66|nr:GNAT family N-acetyltransferase [Parasphingopyxis sp.]
MTVRIRDFQPDDAPAFAALNLAWIDEIFEVEPSDRAQLEDPQSAIIAKGGRIAIAEIDGRVCGCGAVLPAHIQPVPDKYYVEIVKMAAAEDMRGRGIGRAVLDRLIEDAREMGADGIWLETSNKLAAAQHLYRTSGFRDLDDDAFWPTPYGRCNAQLVLEL